MKLRILLVEDNVPTRLGRIGGALTIDTAPGKGTEIIVRVSTAPTG